MAFGNLTQAFYILVFLCCGFDTFQVVSVHNRCPAFIIIFTCIYIIVVARALMAGAGNRARDVNSSRSHLLFSWVVCSARGTFSTVLYNYILLTPNR